MCLNNDYLAVSPKRHETHALRQLKLYYVFLTMELKYSSRYVNAYFVVCVCVGILFFLQFDKAFNSGLGQSLAIQLGSVQVNFSD